MEPFQIETRMVVAGGGLREPIVLRDTKTVCDVNYFRAHRSDELSRLLTGMSRRKVRPLRNTTVFDVVKKLRDSSIETILHPPAQVDLGLDDDQPDQPRKKAKPADIKLPPFVVIKLPPMGGVNETSTKVLTEKSLYMELTSDVLVWLAAAVRQDKDHEEEHVDAEPDDTQTLPKFISYDHTRDAYKVRCKGTQKWFPKSERCNDPLGEAIAFVQHIQRSKA
jgi:hypothetical protein